MPLIVRCQVHSNSTGEGNLDTSSYNLRPKDVDYSCLVYILQTRLVFCEWQLTLQISRVAAFGEIRAS
jgi:hypothetical protein